MRDARESALALPTFLSRLRIQRDQAGLVPWLLPAQFFILAVATAIARHDEQAAIENRRGTKPVLAVELVIAIRPSRPPGKVHRRKAAVAETCIDALAIR